MYPLCLAYMINYPRDWGSLRKTIQAPSTLLRAPTSPRSLRPSGDIIATVNVNRAIEANKRMMRRNHQSVSTSAPHKIIKPASKPTRRANEPSSGLTEPRSQRNCEDINNIIQRHHRKKMGINEAQAEHCSHNQEDATDKRSDLDGARRQMQQIQGCQQSQK